MLRPQRPGRRAAGVWCAILAAPAHAAEAAGDGFAAAGALLVLGAALGYLLGRRAGQRTAAPAPVLPPGGLPGTAREIAPSVRAGERSAAAAEAGPADGTGLIPLPDEDRCPPPDAAVDGPPAGAHAGGMCASTADDWRAVPAEVAAEPPVESYREVVDALSEVLFRTDESGRLVFLNEAWKDLAGFELDYSRQRPLTDFLHPDDRLRARDAIRSLLAGDGQEWSDELRLRTHAGEIRWVGVTCRPVRDRSGQETGIAGTIDDISARKIAEFSLRNLNQELETRVRSRTAELEAALRELEAFSYSVSHDLRAPLRAVDGFARILAEEAGPRLEPRHRDQLARIRAGAERMAILIDALIDLATVTRQPLRRQTVDLSQLAESVIRELQAETPQRRVAVEITRDLTVVADPALMHVLLDNLLRNAWKFTANTEDARIVFGAVREGGRTLFCVEDNGAGFDMNYAGKLFQPFQRLHAQNEFPGTGIGLATVQRIVARHDGWVWASAESGAGARFCFTLGR